MSTPPSQDLCDSFLVDVLLGHSKIMCTSDTTKYLKDQIILIDVTLFCDQNMHSLTVLDVTVLDVQYSHRSDPVTRACRATQ